MGSTMTVIRASQQPIRVYPDNYSLESLLKDETLAHNDRSKSNLFRFYPNGYPSQSTAYKGPT